MSSEQYDSTGTQETRTFSLSATEAASGGYPVGGPSFRSAESPAGGRSPDPYSGTSYGDRSSATQATNTPPYGESYGYDAGNPAPRANDPRRQNGTGSHARHDRTGEGTRTARQAYPQDGYQTGEYPAGGYPAGDHQGNGYQRGSYPTGSPAGSGYPGGGHRAPYDPREDYRRLTQRL
jgi:hypothetical protein